MTEKEYRVVDGHVEVFDGEELLGGETWTALSPTRRLLYLVPKMGLSSWTGVIAHLASRTGIPSRTS